MKNPDAFVRNLRRADLTEEEAQERVATEVDKLLYSEPDENQQLILDWEAQAYAEIERLDFEPEGLFP